MITAWLLIALLIASAVERKPLLADGWMPELTGRVLFALAWPLFAFITVGIWIRDVSLRGRS